MPSTSVSASTSSVPLPRRITRSSTRSSKLRRASPEDLKGYDYARPFSSGSSSDSEEENALPTKIDEPWPFMFQTADLVWIRTAGGHWHRGRVSGQTMRKGVIRSTSTRRRSAEGIFYSVVFNDKLRKYFAPLNGDIKPDNRHTRQLLAEAGFL